MNNEISQKKPQVSDNGRSWGIDLTGRTMWYEPWPVDADGVYRQPTDREIEEIYGISGEAVRETMLYFEERADAELEGGSGPTAERLVAMLNDHVIDERFMVTRNDLLDDSRWYNNEYYFYFIMFSKKVMGRYDFHFGEGSNEPLSKFHRPYEYGNLKFIPWGRDENGKLINEQFGNFVIGGLYFCSSIITDNREGEFKSELIQYLNTFLYNLKRIDILSNDFLEKEFNSYTYEFFYLLYSFFQIFSNLNNIIQKVPEFYLTNYKTKTLSLVKSSAHLSPILFLKNVTSTACAINDFDIVKETKNYYSFKVFFKKHIVKKYHYYKYQNYNLYFHVIAWEGAFSIVHRLIFDLSKNPKSSLLHNPSDHNDFFQMEVSWDLEDKGNLLYASIPIIVISIFIFAIRIKIFLYLIIILLTLATSLLIYFLTKFINRVSIRDEIIIQNQNDFQRSKEIESKITTELVIEKDKLEETVKQRTGELALANEKLKELDRAKTNFFANVSHELRTPLTLILSPIESMLQGQYTKDPGRDFFEGLYVHGARLLRLINNLLDFSKIEAGRMTLNREHADIDRLLPLYVSSMRSGAESHGLTVHYENRAGGVAAYLDTGLFENAMYNLLSNAVKFTPAGGSITVILEADDDAARITVKDTGIGIPADKHGLIFERFSQADESSTRRYEGTGIGLSLTKEIALMHGGDVTVESSEGKGSAFTLSLPRGSGLEKHAERGAAASPVNPARWQHIAESAASRNGKTESAISMEKEHRVLIVEDNEDMLAFLNEIFSENYEVLMAHNGREALDLIKGSDELPGIVVSDVMMPGMDGLDLVHELRKDPCCESIPILLLTARTDVPDRLEGFDRGATDYIAKPFNARELLARVNAQIQLKQVRDRLVRTNEKLYARLKTLSGGGSGPVSDSSEQKVAAVRDFIKENFDADLSREGLAAAVGLSADHLSRVFNKVTGKKIPEYINELRIKQAQSLLQETASSITDIAYTVGFDTVKTFNRVFKGLTGKTPGEYRGMAN